ncbi:hypothetical protein C0995_011856 [Termitomyces sp. Mi166|nr:hypothetical protein C0995_011856 [Termitomyces sp. Mi166\
MDFTEIYKQSSSLVAFSPGAQFILTAVEDRLIVRRTDTLQITRTWLLDASRSPTHASLTILKTSKTKSSSTSNSIPTQEAWISHLGWSCDSEFILAACAKRGIVHLKKLQDEDWTGRIDCGAEGLVKAEWAPDGRTILCFSEWGLRVTTWSLVTGAATYIQFPVYPDKGYAFRADGRYFVLAERHKSKETLGVYDTFDSFKLIRYKLYVLNLAGSTIATFSPDRDPGLGIRCIAWHPNGMFLAVGGWDNKNFSPRLRSVLLHAQPVQHVRWNPVRRGNLVLCCGSPSVYTWSNEWVGEGEEEEEMAECIGVPATAKDSTLPPLLFLHGFPTTSGIWKEQVTYFGEHHGFRLIVPDLLGFGGSSKPTNPEAYKPTLICQDVIDILNAEAIDVAVVIGHGMFVAVKDVVGFD